MSSNRAIIVCGATGMVGSYLTVELLKQGYSDITAISRSKKATQRLKDRLFSCGVGEKFQDIKIAMGRLDDVEFLAGIFKKGAVVYNAAAKVTFSRSNASQLVRDNVTITAAIVEAMRRSQADLLIHTSSIAALDSNHKVIDESCLISSLSGRSPYAISKFYSESEIEKGRINGLKAIIVEPSVILGSGSWNMKHISGLFKMISRGMPLTFSGVTGYVDVVDVARAMVTLESEPNAIGQRYIISSDNLSYQQLFGSIARGLGRKRRSVKVSDRLLRSLSKITQKLERLALPTVVDSTTLECLYSKQLYDGSKIERESSFRYSDIDNAIARIAGEFIATKR